MIKMFLSWVLTAIGSICIMLALVAGLDYIADAITLFTEPGVWFTRAIIGWALAGSINLMVIRLIMADVVNGNSFIDRVFNGGTGQSRGIIGSMRKRMGLD